MISNPNPEPWLNRESVRMWTFIGDTQADVFRKVADFLSAEKEEGEIYAFQIDYVGEEDERRVGTLFYINAEDIDRVFDEAQLLTALERDGLEATAGQAALDNIVLP